MYYKQASQQILFEKCSEILAVLKENFGKVHGTTAF